MMIPVGPSGQQEIYLVTKSATDDTIRTEPVLDVRYVPLTSREKQWWP